MDGPDGYNHYWRDLREPPLIKPTRNSGGGSLALWGGISSLGKLDLVFTSNHVDSEEYQGILDDALIPFLRRHRTKKLVFMQDNASTHSSHTTRSWLFEHNVTVLEWPARSPDLNPIENVWGQLAGLVYAHNKQYESIRDLRAAIATAWRQIKLPYLKSLYSSMNKRVADVIERKGRAINY